MLGLGPTLNSSMGEESPSMLMTPIIRPMNIPETLTATGRPHGVGRTRPKSFMDSVFITSMSKPLLRVSNNSGSICCTIKDNIYYVNTWRQDDVSSKVLVLLYNEHLLLLIPDFMIFLFKRRYANSWLNSFA